VELFQSGEPFTAELGSKGFASGFEAACGFHCFPIDASEGRFIPCKTLFVVIVHVMFVGEVFNVFYAFGGDIGFIAKQVCWA
jgi:hypothetical protein